MLPPDGPPVNEIGSPRRVASGRPGPSRKAVGVEPQDCTIPLITSIHPFPTVHHRDYLDVEGCGFSPNTEIVLYDPKGINDAFKAPVP